VALPRTPLRAFPELGPRLRHKQCGAATALRDRLARALAALQQVRDAVSGRVGTVFQLYEEAAAELGLEAAVQRSALSPSLADALAWLQDVEHYYRQAYLECKLLLLQAHHEDLSELEALPQAWERLLERHNPDIVEDTLLKVSLFLETG
ncbi:PREDICTED: uncharacterized protein C1orf109 homolog, partial [Gavialis gangeticus]|uniref:uncharacterized protein C1orf109 homolog n=1 Tax=Gavialis gangeticus TaxID=94835 RepID=UPI00092F9706